MPSAVVPNVSMPVPSLVSATPTVPLTVPATAVEMVTPSAVLLLPAASRYVWGSADKYWSAHALQATWDTGDYHLRYCTPILGKLVCTNTVEITVLQ